MYKLIGGAAMLIVLSACGVGSDNGYNTYCVEEQEANGLDYMIVSDKSVCDNPNADAEWYGTDQRFNIGDIAFVESDSDHSVKRPRKYTEIRNVPTYPAYTPATKAPTICLKANYAPAPPAPKPPAPAPKPVQPAPVVPKPAPAPVQTPPKVNTPVAPKPATPVPTYKPGC